MSKPIYHETKPDRLKSLTEIFGEPISVYTDDQAYYYTQDGTQYYVTDLTFTDPTTTSTVTVSDSPTQAWLKSDKSKVI